MIGEVTLTCSVPKSFTHDGHRCGKRFPHGRLTGNTAAKQWQRAIEKIVFDLPQCRFKIGHEISFTTLSMSLEYHTNLQLNIALNRCFYCLQAAYVSGP